jgi:hypothetical protein
LAQKVKESEENLKAKAKQQKAEVIQLPLWGEVERAIPNHIARSSLFAPIARGRRKHHQGTILVSRSDAVIEYWGIQLDEAQADVWIQAIHEARQVPLGQDVTINRAAFLRAIGRDTGKWQYEWLLRTMKTLTVSALMIEVRKEGKTRLKVKNLNLLDEFDLDEEAGQYKLKINPKWLTLYENSEFALIDWQKRFLIGKRVDLAKRLQRLVATSADKVQRYSLEYLKEVCCHEGRMRDFRTALTDALDELERLHIIRNPKIETSSQGKEQAYWQRIKE